VDSLVIDDEEEPDQAPYVVSTARDALSGSSSGTLHGRARHELIEPGHDSSVVGDEPVVTVEFESETAEEFATG